MTFKSSSKFPSANIGDSVRVPEVDRSKGDPRNILDIYKNQNYKLGTKNGTLNKNYTQETNILYVQNLLSI